jgi:hypothetical protein
LLKDEKKEQIGLSSGKKEEDGHPRQFIVGSYCLHIILFFVGDFTFLWWWNPSRADKNLLEG